MRSGPRDRSSRLAPGPAGSFPPLRVPAEAIDADEVEPCARGRDVQREWDRTVRVGGPARCSGPAATDREADSATTARENAPHGSYSSIAGLGASRLVVGDGLGV